ncbi:MAG: hypothetical protein H7211_00935 [Aquabacterium sp.]|nr:hypothetical protein [Ferruginibacter sp.]
MPSINIHYANVIEGIPGLAFGPHYGNSYRARSTKSNWQVADIQHDYDEKIWAAKHDKTLRGRKCGI